MGSPTALVRRATTAAWRRRTVVLPLLLAATLTASATGYSLIRVHPGDTLSGLAARYHTSVARLIKLNDLPGNGDLIYAGQQLRIPDGHRSAPRPGRRHAAHCVVRPGDTLDGIAARFHVRPDRVARRNHLPPSLIVMIGQRLTIPGGAHRARHHSRRHSRSTAAGRMLRRERHVLARHSEPSRDAVAAIIRSTAGRWGVDPRLALAVSWQEAGFNMREISPAGAIGALQVMPATGAYLAANVVHRSLDLYAARDNITAGVALLSVLVHEAVSPRQAIAGYYQGLQSVRDHGMLPDTKQYVADVMALRSRF